MYLPCQVNAHSVKDLWIKSLRRAKHKTNILSWSHINSKFTCKISYRQLDLPTNGDMVYDIFGECKRQRLWNCQYNCRIHFHDFKCQRLPRTTETEILSLRVYGSPLKSRNSKIWLHNVGPKYVLSPNSMKMWLQVAEIISTTQTTFLKYICDRFEQKQPDGGCTF